MEKTRMTYFKGSSVTKRQLHIRLVSPVIVFLMILALAGNSLAASFSADMIQTKKKVATTSRFYMRDNQYRMDAKEEGMVFNILVDRKSGKTRIVVPDEKVYLEIENDSMQSLMNNPFEARQKMIKMFQTRSSGSETVEGIKCEKQIISSDGKDFMIVWIARTLDFPVRIENLDNGDMVELKNIKNASLKTSLFEVPAGYKLVDAMPVAPPEWAADAARAPVMTPPFEKNLEEGQVVRINPRAGYAIVVNGRSPDGGKCSFTSVAFKDGRPLVDPSMGTFNVSGSSSMGTRHKQEPGEADYVVVRARTGRVAIKTEFAALPPKGVLLKEFSLKANSGKVFDLDHRKASRVYVSDDSGDGKATRGKVTIYTVTAKNMDGGTIYEPREIGKEDLVLENGKSRMWEFEEKEHISHMDMDIFAGGVDVRIEQPQVAGEIPPSWTKEVKPEPEQEAAAAPPKPAPAKVEANKPVTAMPQSKEEAQALKAPEAKPGDTSFMNGEVPLYKGAKVTKTQTYGANTMAELDVAAKPQEVLDFYGREMPGKGWTAGPTMVRGPQGMATFIQANRQMVIKVVDQGGTSKVSISIITY